MRWKCPFHSDFYPVSIHKRHISALAGAEIYHFWADTIHLLIPPILLFFALMVQLNSPFCSNSSSGKHSGVNTDDVSRMKARSRRFSSSRMLPGHRLQLFEHRLHGGVFGVNKLAHFRLPELIPQIIEFQIPDDDLANGFGDQPHLVGDREIGDEVGSTGL
jgi:hypothetical protein